MTVCFAPLSRMIQAAPLAVAAVATWFGMALGAAAQTACPTAANLENGIALIREEPFYSNVMTRIEGGLAEARMMARDGVVEDVSTTFAHALAVTQRVGSGGTLSLSYGDDTFALDGLPELGQWSTEVTLSVEGVPRFSGQFTAEYFGQVTITLGDCSYETWQVRSTLALEGRAPIFQETYFSPELQLTLGTVSLDAEGNPVGGVLFDRIVAR